MTRKVAIRPVISHPRETVLDKHQLAAALGIGERVAMQLDLPFTMAGRRQLFVWGQVLDVLAERALPSAPERDQVAAARSIECLRTARRTA